MLLELLVLGSRTLLTQTCNYISNKLHKCVMSSFYLTELSHELTNFPRFSFVVAVKFNHIYRNKFSSYIWKRIDGLILDSLKEELAKERRQVSFDW